MHKITRQFLIKTAKFILFWLVFGFLFYLLGRYIKFFVPLLGGLILSAIMLPLVNFLQSHTRLSRKWAVAIVLILVILVLGSVFTWFTILAVQQAQDLASKWPHYLHSFKRSFAEIWPRIEGLYIGLNPRLNEAAMQSLDKLGSSASEFVTKSVLGVSTLAFLLPELFIILVIALVAAYFITRNWEAYKQSIISVFPHEWRDGLSAIGSDFSKALVGFLRAQLILVIGTIIFTIAGLAVLHTRYAFVLGIIIGLCGILPVLGAGLVLVPWAVVEILLGHASYGLGLLALVGIMSVTRHVVEPKIVGDNVGLDPLFVLLSMFIGLEAIGPVGLIIGPFVVIFYKSLQKAGVFKNL